ncbi:MAG: F0F1 ATP synthase subunit B' [Rhodospirillales bacterium]|nr:F0F1 ATP synthase subunit B' [Rhodospirillales bacterium]MDH3916791.1 F0F1 ATP synthase subunit B' [Rhodospirillales bacterium]MDH3966734.1 F0F1 ATP synthase subunit B' [Rhodospirillales bacterium]
MPQLDPSNYAGQIFWLVISFVALYWVLVRLALPRIADVLEARQHKIDDDLDRAAAAKQEADKVLAAYDKRLAEGRDEAQGLLRQAAEEMAAEAAKRHESLAAKLAGEVKAAETRILEAKTAAVRSIGEVAAEVAQSAARRLIGIEVDGKTAGAAVEAAMRGSD